MSLKPKRIEVDCVFICPSCHSEHWYTIRQLRQIRYLDCVCGKKTKIQPVSSVDVRYKDNVIEQFNKTGKRAKKQLSKKPTIAQHINFPLNDFIGVLTNLGMQKAQAKKLVVSHQDEYSGSEEEFLKLLLTKTP